MTACMGGWCPARDHCARYHQTERQEPAERLCMPSEANMLLALRPVVVVYPREKRHDFAVTK